MDYKNTIIKEVLALEVDGQLFRSKQEIAGYLSRKEMERLYGQCRGRHVEYDDFCYRHDEPDPFYKETQYLF